MAHNRSINPNLDGIVATLAEWSKGRNTFTFYLFGSQVRGDTHAGSDVDVFAVWNDRPTDEDTEWWTAQNGEEFASISSRLPGKLHPQYRGDPLEPDILKAAENPILRRDNIICIWTPPKSTLKRD